MLTAPALLEGGASDGSDSSFGTNVWRGFRDVLHSRILGAPTPQPELFQLYEEEPGGSRPLCLGEPREPQEKVQQCTVEQVADVVPMVQILNTPWLLGEDQVVEVLRKLDVPAVEQVIAVPLISLDRVPQLSAIRRPQKAEQLVEVPTESAYSLAVIAVQALGRRAAAALAEQIVYNPVPQVRRGGGGGLQGLRAGQGSTVADVEQMVDIPVPLGRWEGGGGVQGFLPGQGSTASSSSRLHDDADEGIQEVFFALFPSPKKCEGCPPVESESARQCHLIQAERSSTGSSRGV